MTTGTITGRCRLCNKPLDDHHQGRCPHKVAESERSFAYVAVVWWGILLVMLGRWAWLEYIVK